MRTIYGLVDPADGQIHYVGATVQPLAPYLRAHISGAVRDHPDDREWVRTRKDRWIRQLHQIGLQPTIVSIHEVPDAEWREAESATITQLLTLGCPLTNAKPGGGGGATKLELQARRLEQAFA